MSGDCRCGGHGRTDQMRAARRDLPAFEVAMLVEAQRSPGSVCPDSIPRHIEHRIHAFKSAARKI